MRGLRRKKNFSLSSNEDRETDIQYRPDDNDQNIQQERQYSRDRLHVRPQLQIQYLKTKSFFCKMK